MAGSLRTSGRTRRSLAALRLLACIIVVVGIPLADAAAQITFSVGVATTEAYPTIRIPVRVIDNSAVITSLKASDFTVHENGAPMSPLRLDCTTVVEQDTLNVVFVIDVSLSMAFIEGTRRNDPDSLKWRKAKQVTSLAFSKLRAQDRGALISFCRYPNTEQWFTTDITALDRALYGLSICEGTSLHDAIDLAVSIADGQPGKTIIIVMTDGGDTTSRLHLIDAINAARREFIPVFSIGLGVDAQGGAALDSLSRMTGGEYHLAPTSAQLEDVFKRIMSSIYDNSCILSYETPDTCRAGGLRSVDVAVTVAGSTFTGSTLYAVDDFRSHVALRPAVADLVADDQTHVIPVMITGEVRAGEGIDVEADITFDPALWRFAGIRRTGTLTDGATPLLASEAPAGTVHVSGHDIIPTMGVPYGSEAPFFAVELEALHQTRNIATSIDLRNIVMRQECEMLPTSSSDTTVINGCLALARISVEEPMAVPAGNELRLPLVLHDAIDLAQPLRVTTTVYFDAARLAYLRTETRATIASTLDVSVVERVPGELAVVIDGARPADSIGVLCTFVFRSIPHEASATTPVTLASTMLVQSCLPVIQTSDATVALDGTCERVVARLPGARLAQSIPNPATALQPVITVTYETAGEEDLRLELVDMTGRPIAVLAEGRSAAGRYSASFDMRGLPAGTYLCMLREGRTVLTRPLIWSP